MATVKRQNITFIGDYMISSVLTENILVSKQNDMNCQGLLGLFLYPVLP